MSSGNTEKASVADVEERMVRAVGGVRKERERKILETSVGTWDFI